MEEIMLKIPMLPPANVSPNKLRQGWKQRAPLVKQNKIDFSKILEDILPFHVRPNSPLETAHFVILFKIPHTNLDPCNLYGRMKPWEDILVHEGILANDSFKVVKSVKLLHIVVPEDRGVLWHIVDEEGYTSFKLQLLDNGQ